MTTLSILTIAFCALSIVCLIALHFTSPEFQPSWRMVSEYALGKYKWLLTAFFTLWALGSFTTCFLLWNGISGTAATAGLILLFISSVGGLMGGLFDAKHKLHGLAALLGVPTLPIAAMLIGYNLGQPNNTILLASHATWIAFVIMAVAMVVMMNGFKKAGIPMGPDATPPDHVPNGVIALAGYANRLLIVCNMGWLVTVAIFFLNKSNI
jgi:Protein of unknown function (DUF998)